MNPVMIAVIAFTSFFHSILEVTPTATITSSAGATMAPSSCTPIIQSSVNATGSPAAAGAAEEYYPDTDIPKNYKKKITIAYLSAMKGTFESRQGLVISGALQLALNEVSFVVQIILVVFFFHYSYENDL